LSGAKFEPVMATRRPPWQSRAKAEAIWRSTASAMRRSTFANAEKGGFITTTLGVIAAISSSDWPFWRNAFEPGLAPLQNVGAVLLGGVRVAPPHNIKAALVCALHYDTDHPLLAAYAVIAVQLPSKTQIPHGDERPIGLRGTAFLRFQNRGQ
jgi:hypothetical protein